MTPFRITKLLDPITTGLDRLAQDNHNPDVKRIVRSALMIYVIYHSSSLLPYHRFVWGDLMPAYHGHTAGGSALVWILTWSRVAAEHGLQLWVVLAQLACAGMALAGVAPRLTVPAVYVLTMNVNAMNPVILDGGNNLSQLLLFYLCFIELGGAGPAGSKRRALANSVSNCALFVAQLQVVAVYLCAGLYKVNGELWQNGMALFYIFQVDEYTHPLVHDLMLSAPWLSVIGTYFTLAFQLSFPWVVWQRGWPRRLVISAGIMLHTGIALVMGLFAFGMVMCLVYTLFLEQSTAQAICARLARVRASLPRLRVRAPADAT